MKVLKEYLLVQTFIAISKLEGVEWSQINQYLGPKLEDFFESGEQAVAMTDDMQESINLDDMSDEEKRNCKRDSKNHWWKS